MVLNKTCAKASCDSTIEKTTISYESAHRDHHHEIDITLTTVERREFPVYGSTRIWRYLIAKGHR